MVSMKSFSIEVGKHIISTFWRISFNSLFSKCHLLKVMVCFWKFSVIKLGWIFQNNFTYPCSIWYIILFLPTVFICAQTLAIRTLIHIRTSWWRAVVRCCLPGALFGLLAYIFCDVGCSVAYLISVRFLLAGAVLSWAKPALSCLIINLCKLPDVSLVSFLYVQEFHL